VCDYILGHIDALYWCSGDCFCHEISSLCADAISLLYSDKSREMVKKLLYTNINSLWPLSLFGHNGQQHSALVKNIATSASPTAGRNPHTFSLEGTKHRHAFFHQAVHVCASSCGEQGKVSVCSQTFAPSQKDNEAETFHPTPSHCSTQWPSFCMLLAMKGKRLLNLLYPAYSPFSFSTGMLILYQYKHTGNSPTW
jgi:hypothetical protein